jgi:uncharacterized protein YhdP
VALGASLLIAYQAALARIPHQRAAIERVLRAYTGLDLRFATLEFGWGWGGPEAVFSRVELGEPERTSVRVRAQRLVIGFNSWASFRRGQLEISRVALVEPDIDLTGEGGGPDAGSSPARRAGAGDPGDEFATELLTWLARAPLGRIDIEAGTLRLPATRTSRAGAVLGLNRATLRRTSESLSASAYAYLPEGLGRSVYLTLRLDGDLRSRTTLRGTSRIVGQRLALGPWSELLALKAGAPQGGVADVRARLDYGQGRLVGVVGEFTADGPVWARSRFGGERVGWRRVRGRVDLESSAEVSRLRLSNLVFTRDRLPAPAARLALEWRRGRPQLAGSADGVPAEALAAVLALSPDATAFDPPPPLATTGTAHDVRFTLDRACRAGQCLRLSARLDDAALRVPGSGGFQATGLEGQVEGTGEALTLRLGGAHASLRWGTQPAVSGLAVGGELRLLRGSAGWTLSGERVRVASVDGEAWLSGTLDARAGRAPTFALAADVPAVAADHVRNWLPVADDGAAVGARIVSGRLTGLHIELRGMLGPAVASAPVESSGHVSFADLRLRADGRWPAVQDLAGRFSWARDLRRLELTGGSAAGLLPAAPVTGLHGTLVVERGAVRPGRLQGTWLGGPAALRLRDGMAQIHAEGAADGAQLAQRLEIRPVGVAPAMEGRIEWRANIAPVAPVAAAAASGAAGWQFEFDSSLTGLTSRLPAPLSKVAGESLPLHVVLRPDVRGSQLLAVSIGGRARALLRIVEHSGLPAIERGVVHFGDDERSVDRAAAAALRLPARPALEASGRLAELDLPALLAVLDLPPVELRPLLTTADLVVGAVLVAGQRFEDVRIVAHAGSARTRLALTSTDLSGRLEWPAGTTGGAGRVALDFLRLRGRVDPGDLPILAASLGEPGASFDVTQLEWDALRLGHVTAELAASEGVLHVDALRVERPSHELRGMARCGGTPLECRVRLQIASTDAAATLRDFGFADEVAASRARLTAELVLPLAGAPGPLLARASGRLALEVSAGRIMARPGADSFPLLAMAPLYAPELPEAPLSPGRGVGPEFDLLTASFEVEGGVASTADFRLAATDYEVLARGSIDLAAHGYDQDLLVLRGGDRLPETVQRIGGGPRIAAAWLALRGALRPADGSAAASQQYRLRGHWDAPLLEPGPGLP